MGMAVVVSYKATTVSCMVWYPDTGTVLYGLLPGLESANSANSANPGLIPRETASRSSDDTDHGWAANRLRCRRPS